MLLQKIKSLFSYNEEINNSIPTAEEAYYRTKYGFYTSVENRIKTHQRNIKSLIEAKMNNCYRGSNMYTSYYCVYDFDKDMEPYTEEVLKPFKENGFNIVNINDKVTDLDNEIIYLITWNRKE